MQIDFSLLRLDDATIKDIQISADAICIEYLDWQERTINLVFKNAISCYLFSPHGKPLLRGTVESSGDYLNECCRLAEEDDFSRFRVFNFVDAWNDNQIVRIVAEWVEEI